MSIFLNNLSEEQSTVVTHEQVQGNPLLIRAGAGAGKTKTIVNRIGYLIEQEKASPREFCVLSFSNKSAREIRERIRSSIGDGVDELLCGTFHSISLKFLREFFKFEGNVCDSEDTDSIILHYGYIPGL